MRLAITAGFDRSPAALALAELLRRAGQDIAVVVVVTPWSLRRARALIMQRGMGVIRTSVKKLTAGSGSGSASHGPDPMREFLAGQQIADRSLRAWCRRNGVKYVSLQDINSPQAIAALNEAAIDAVVYGGGGILRKPFIDAARRRVINPHCGPLPDIRGMNAIEWAILLEKESAITVHYIDEGIDTGAIIRRVGVPVIAREPVDSLRARAVVTGIREIVAQLSAPQRAETAAPEALPITGRQCYTMAPVLKELLQYKLNRL